MFKDKVKVKASNNNKKKLSPIKNKPNTPGNNSISKKLNQKNEFHRCLEAFSDCV